MGILENGQTVFFLVPFWWNSDFFADFFPKVYTFWINSVIIFALSKFWSQFLRYNCHVQGAISTFARIFFLFHIFRVSLFFWSSITVFYSFIIFYHFFCVKRKITSVMTDFWNKFTFLTISWMRVIDIQCFNLTVKKI